MKLQAFRAHQKLNPKPTQTPTKTVYCILKTYNNYTLSKTLKPLNNSKPVKTHNGTTLAKWDNVDIPFDK